MDVFISKSANCCLFIPNPGVIKWLERRVIHTNTHYSQSSFSVCLNVSLRMNLLCSILWIIHYAFVKKLSGKGKIKIAVFGYHGLPHNLTLTSEHSQGTVWDLAGERFWSKMRGLCLWAEMQPCSSSGVVSSCCVARGVGILHFSVNITFHLKKHFGFLFSSHDLRKMVTNVTLQARKPNKRTWVHFTFISWLILGLTRRFILLERPT